MRFTKKENMSFIILFDFTVCNFHFSIFNARLAVKRAHSYISNYKSYDFRHSTAQRSTAFKTHLCGGNRDSDSESFYMIQDNTI